MGALRRAGVWLGLIEDEHDRDSFYDDELVDDEEYAVPPRGRTVSRPTQRRADPGERLVDAREPSFRPGADTREPRARPGGRDLHVVREPRERDRTVRRVERHDYDEPTERPVSPPLRVAEPREQSRAERLDRGGRGDEGSVRPIPRPTAGSTALSVPSQENLTLAPSVQLRERAAVSDERVTRRHEITTLHPASYSDARAIGEQFRDGHPVLMNLTDLAEADAKRLVDFAAGLAFGLRGGIERVTNRVFLLTPPNIRVSDEDRQRIAEPGFFEQR